MSSWNGLQNDFSQRIIRLNPVQMAQSPLRARNIILDVDALAIFQSELKVWSTDAHAT